MLELVTGGSGSGKSAYAEEHICRIHPDTEQKSRQETSSFLYCRHDPAGEETLRKIERHRKMRETRGFQTLEWYTDIAGKIREKSLPENACVLLECLSNLTANEIYEPEGAGENAADAVTEGVRMLKDSCAAVVVVTNEVFSEVSSESGGKTDEMTEYKRILERSTDSGRDSGPGDGGGLRHSLRCQRRPGTEAGNRRGVPGEIRLGVGRVSRTLLDGRRDLFPGMRFIHFRE